MKVPKFTPSEERVVRLISLGLSTKEVARVLGKAVSTVDNQRTSAMRAAEINTATLLVRVALLAGITTLDDTLTAAERRRLKAGAPKRARAGPRRRAASSAAREATLGPAGRSKQAAKGRRRRPQPVAAKVARTGQRAVKKGAKNEPAAKVRRKPGPQPPRP